MLAVVQEGLFQSPALPEKHTSRGAREREEPGREPWLSEPRSYTHSAQGVPLRRRGGAPRLDLLKPLRETLNPRAGGRC
jgi:hypothetical protein